MPWIAPHNSNGISFRGETIAPDEDGIVDISKYHAEYARDLAHALETHGFQPVDAERIKEAKESRAAAMKLAASKDAECRISAGEIVEPETDGEDKEKGYSDEELEKITAEDIETMPRSELFAFLKQHSVSTRGQMTNEELRELAHETMSKSGDAA